MANTALRVTSAHYPSLWGLVDGLSLVPWLIARDAHLPRCLISDGQYAITPPPF